MGVGSGGQGGVVPPLDFQTWYKNIVDSGLKVLFFRPFLLFFGLFSVAPSTFWKRLNSSIFRYFC